MIKQALASEQGQREKAEQNAAQVQGQMQQQRDSLTQAFSHQLSTSNQQVPL